jgi:hypothetical protein
MEADLQKQILTSKLEIISTLEAQLTKKKI